MLGIVDGQFLLGQRQYPPELALHISVLVQVSFGRITRRDIKTTYRRQPVNG